MFIRDVYLKNGFITVNSKLARKSKQLRTIDFIAANNTSLSKQGVSSVTCGTPEIKIDNALSKYFQSKRMQVLIQSTMGWKTRKSASSDTCDESSPSESPLETRQTSIMKQRTDSSKHLSRVHPVRTHTHRHTHLKSPSFSTEYSVPTEENTV